MKTPAVRAFLAVTVVGVFMTITAFMALYPLLTKANVDMDKYADFFAKTASVYTGIIGVIVGYYFGREGDAKTASRSSSGEGDAEPPAGK